MQVSILLSEVSSIKTENQKLTTEVDQLKSKISTYQNIIDMQNEIDKKYERLTRIVETLPEVTKKMAFIKGINKSFNTYSVELDYVEWFSGEEASRAAEEDRVNAASLNNGFYIRNKQIDKDIVTLTNRKMIYILNGASTQYTELDKFVTEELNGNERLFNVLMIDREAVIIEEQYRP